jgi:hypothetical protein
MGVIMIEFLDERYSPILINVLEIQSVHPMINGKTKIISRNDVNVVSQPYDEVVKIIKIKHALPTQTKG